MPVERTVTEDTPSEEWFQGLFDAYYKRVNYTALSITKDYHLAQDVVQETFYKAYRHYGTLKDRKNAGVWLDMIARNTAIDFYRKKVRLQEFYDESVMTNTASLQVGVEQVLEQKLFRELILSLEPSHRNALLLVYEYGLTYEQLAGYQKTSVSAIKSRIHRAKAKLRSVVLEMEQSC